MTRRTSGDLTLFGILNLLYGLSGAVMSGLGVAFICWLRSQSTPDTDVFQLIPPSTPVFGAIGAALGLLLAAGGIGVMRHALWGRTLALVSAGGQIACTLLFLVACELHRHSPAVLELTRKYGELGGGDTGAWFLFGIIYPLAIVGYFTRRSTIEKFSDPRIPRGEQIF